MLGQLESDGIVVVADFEAGLGTLSRMEKGDVDVVLVLAEPTAKAIQVAQRALALIEERKIGRSILLANRVAGEADIDAIRRAFPEESPVFVPDDPAIRSADAAGKAAIDAAPEAPAVRAMSALADAIMRG